MFQVVFQDRQEKNVVVPGAAEQVVKRGKILTARAAIFLERLEADDAHAVGGKVGKDRVGLTGALREIVTVDAEEPPELTGGRLRARCRVAAGQQHED
jgi:hypothetical protein